MLQKVEIAKQINQKDFLKFISTKQKKGLLSAAKLMRGKRVIHLNATAVGGGVAEILKSLIPYLRSLGVQSDWYAIDPAVGNNFFSVTNKIHNTLQGAPLKITAKEWGLYKKVSKQITEELNKMDCDILVIHDPQPLLAGHFARSKQKIFFCHIDTSSAYKPFWNKIIKYFKTYRRIIFSNCEFVNKSLLTNKIKIFTPAIDPLSPKQKIVPHFNARRYLQKYGIPEKAPLVSQISRFDVWKNPLGVIQAFRLVQQTYPNARLAMVGFNEAKDNPAAAKTYEDIAAIAKKSSNIDLFFNPKNINIMEFTVMAQNGADVIVQNSIKEGFGLVVSEAMWKSQPVIGGPASGVRKQITNNKNGFIVKSSEDLAEKIIYLLEHPNKKKMMGKKAKNAVVEKFLFPRLVLDHLKTYKECLMFRRSAKKRRFQKPHLH